MVCVLAETDVAVVASAALCSLRLVAAATAGGGAGAAAGPFFETGTAAAGGRCCAAPPAPPDAPLPGLEIRLGADVAKSSLRLRDAPALLDEEAPPVPAAWLLTLLVPPAPELPRLLPPLGLKILDMTPFLPPLPLPSALLPDPLDLLPSPPPPPLFLLFLKSFIPPEAGPAAAEAPST